MAILYVIAAIIIIILVIGLLEKSTNAICLSKKRLDEKTIIVTGGTTGMGLKIAIDLAERGARLIITCPFEKEAELARKAIVNETGNEQVTFKVLDLSSIASIRKFVSEIYESEDRLDILINNAGVGAVAEFLTEDGMSYIMQVNYFGQFLLTLLLLPLLKRKAIPSEPARIVNISSVLHNLGTVNFDKINDIKYYSSLRFYSNSKLCVVLFAHELTKRLKQTNIVINCVDPGAVATGIFYCYGKIFGSITKILFYVFFKTPWEGAQTTLHVALDKNAGMVSGQMFKNCKLSRAKSAAYNDNTAENLWELSIKLVRLSDKELKSIF